MLVNILDERCIADRIRLSLVEKHGGPSLRQSASTKAKCEYSYSFGLGRFKDVIAPSTEARNAIWHEPYAATLSSSPATSSATNCSGRVMCSSA